MPWLKYLRVNRYHLTAKAVDEFWIDQIQNVCHSHGCPVPRRINIGSRYQAEVPELRQRSAVELDHHRAEMVWAPLGELEEKPDFQEKGKKSTKYSISYFTSPETESINTGRLIVRAGFVDFHRRWWTSRFQLFTLKLHFWMMFSYINAPYFYSTFHTTSHSFIHWA